MGLRRETSTDPNNATILQARIAIDLAILILEKKTYAKKASPVIEVLDSSNLAKYDLGKLLPPKGQRMQEQELPD
ncbi:hypothetical protein [Janthinobacterium sp. B9-8]|uniref:hypothetical protein n=1 Tax=Janthinobacterium sp. B9-8 TaxID=1236179 RepID=UPI00061D3642|nr:hypothetical protein [Janthinobacterium sp. B9-8]AMC34618.1 hypothetical protein VN23_08375 [Janthinobacterium sp. B9-8]